jgi:seryl-tRNA synthetase
MTNTEVPPALEEQRRTFRDELIENRWLLSSASTALPGLGPAAVAVYDGLAALLYRVSRQEFDADIMPVRFPPVFAARMLEQTDYVASFPQLLGAITSFLGDKKQFRDLLAAYSSGEDWQRFLEPTGFALTSSACHPLYGWLEGSVADNGTIYELTGDCFRHEPSEDPMRFVAFRMREYVRLGTEEQAKAHRDASLDIAKGVYESLGLDVSVVPANDPFFGRGGAILASNQLESQAKFEIVVEIYPGTETAIGSGNYHDTHFGEEFSITTPDGATAHSSCLGYGMERTVLALARRHGFDLASWPTAVKTALGLSA